MDSSDPAPSSGSPTGRTITSRVANGSDLCSCGKPATHLNAPEDSDDWACLVRDPGDYTPPAWLRDERAGVSRPFGAALITAP